MMIRIILAITLIAGLAWWSDGGPKWIPVVALSACAVTFFVRKLIRI